MNQAQKDAWINLKKAVDKYSQATGAEVAVVTKFYPITALTENYLPQGNIKAELAVHGHGGLSSLVKNALNPKDDWPKSRDNENLGKKINNHHNQNKSGFPLSSSYHTLKLDQESVKKPELFPTNSSSNNSNDSSLSPSIPQGGLGKKKSKKKRDKDGDLELDENLLFGEEEIVNESDESDSSDDSSVEGIGHLPPRRFHGQGQNRYSNQGGRGNQFATSLPVSINFGWGQNDSSSRLRYNQVPPPPTYNQPISTAQTNAQVIQAEQTPHLDTIMASMQALARSVTDDTSLIFGERPRPRVYKE